MPKLQKDYQVSKGKDVINVSTQTFLKKPPGLNRRVVNSGKAKTGNGGGLRVLHKW